MAQPANEIQHVMAIPEAGRRYLGIGRSLSYDLARRGQIPTLQLGRRRVVPVALVEKSLRGMGNARAARASAASLIKKPPLRIDSARRLQGRGQG